MKVDEKADFNEADQDADPSVEVMVLEVGVVRELA